VLLTKEEQIFLHDLEEKYKDDKHSDISKMVKLLIRMVNNLYALNGNVDAMRYITKKKNSERD